MRSNATNRNQTHNPAPIDREKFRAQATGTGSTVARSLATGLMRSASVSIPTDQRKALPKHGGGHRPMPEPVESGFGDSEFGA